MNGTPIGENKMRITGVIVPGQLPLKFEGVHVTPEKRIGSDLHDFGFMNTPVLGARVDAERNRLVVEFPFESGMSAYIGRGENEREIVEAGTLVRDLDGGK